MFGCLICVNTMHPRTQSSPANHSVIKRWLVFILALICEYQTHRCVLIYYLLNSVDLQTNSNTTGSQMKCVIFFSKYVLFQSSKIKFSLFVQWKSSPLGCSNCQREAPSNSAMRVTCQGPLGRACTENIDLLIILFRSLVTPGWYLSLLSPRKNLN